MTYASLPFNGDPRYVSVFWATFVLWNAAELFLNVKRHPAGSENHDRGSFRLLVLMIGTAFMLDFACALLLPATAMTRIARTAFAVGIGCTVAGAALRWYAVATLKPVGDGGLAGQRLRLSHRRRGGGTALCLGRTLRPLHAPHLANNPAAGLVSRFRKFAVPGSAALRTSESMRTLAKHCFLGWFVVPKSAPGMIHSMADFGTTTLGSGLN